MSRRILIVAFIVAAGACFVGPAQASRDMQASAQRLRALDWKPENGLTLPDSRIVLAPLDGVFAVTGITAIQARIVQDGTPERGVEAELLSDSGLDAVYTWLSIGFLDDGDPKHLDADQLLAGMRESTERDNAARVAGGLGAITLKGWAQPPTVDTNAHTLSWIAQADQGGKPLFNASALLLGRKGVERVQMVSYKDADTARRELAQVLAATHFGAGTTYADHVASDPSALSGMAALGLPGVGPGDASSPGTLASLMTPSSKLSEALPRIIGLSLFMLVVFGFLIRQGLRGRTARREKDH